MYNSLIEGLKILMYLYVGAMDFSIFVGSLGMLLYRRSDVYRRRR